MSQGRFCRSGLHSACRGCSCRCHWRRALLPVAAIALAGCASISSPAPAPAPAPVPSGALLAVHDPGQVTWEGGDPAPGTCHARDGGRLPDPRCTPGSADPAVTQADIGATICRSGYTATVRPPESAAEGAKYNVMYPAYSMPRGVTSELDHLVSLELGGSNDEANLWPEAGSVPNPKDAVENRLHDAVCSGQVTLAAAQQAIAADWETALAALGLKK